MDQVLFNERFQYATIQVFKDYCKLTQKNLDINFLNSEEIIELDDFLTTKGGVLVTNPDSKMNWSKGKIFRLPLNPQKKTYYFSTSSEEQRRYTLEFLYKNKKTDNSFQTTNDRQIKRHFNKPFSSISLNIFDRTIKLKGNKLIISFYHGTRTRNVNCIYFIKSFEVYSISIDLVKGNFTTSYRRKYRKQTTNTFRCNSFLHLNDVLCSNILQMNKKDSFFDKHSKLYKSFMTVFNDDKFCRFLFDKIQIDYNQKDIQKIKTFKEGLIKFFIEKKKIKIPNGDHKFWITYFYPTEKYLIRNDRKLIASVLDMLGIKSKISIKLFHKYPNINVHGFVQICKLFGEDYSNYLGNMNEIVFENAIRDKDGEIQNYKFFLLNHVNKDLELNQTDKENLLRYINNITNYTTDIFSKNEIDLLVDHFKMIKKIRNYDVSISMRATTIKEFQQEHIEFAKIIAAMKKGWVIEYQFKEKMLEEIEKPIKSYCECETIEHERDFIMVYPFVLKREEEFIEEGNFMHHCVATYVDREESIIVSIRNNDASDRLTCEFRIQDGKCIQARHFCNGGVPEHFKDALETLSDKIILHARWGTLNWSEKKKVPLKINGVEVVKTKPTYLDDDEFLDF